MFYWGHQSLLTTKAIFSPSKKKIIVIWPKCYQVHALQKNHSPETISGRFPGVALPQQEVQLEKWLLHVSLSQLLCKWKQMVCHSRGTAQNHPQSLKGKPQYLIGHKRCNERFKIQVICYVYACIHMQWGHAS